MQKFRTPNNNLRRIIETIIALFFGIFQLIALGAVLSYSPEDPSFLHASDSKVHNIVGRYAAYAVDPALQAFGGAVFLLLSIIFINSLAVVLGRRIRFYFGTIMGMLSLVLMSLFLASFRKLGTSEHLLMYEPMQDMWYGGFLGHYLYSVLSPGIDPRIFTAVTGVLVCLISLSALNISLSQWISGISITYRGVLKIARYCFNSMRAFSKRKKLSLSERKTIPRVAGQVESPEESSYQTTGHSRQSIDVEDLTFLQNGSGEDTSSVHRARYTLPYTALLHSPRTKTSGILDKSILQENARLLMQVLHDFGVMGDILDIYQGPVVTLYELQPAAGIKSSRIIGLADDIARSMSALSARIAVIPGKNAVGIELPNKHRETVYLGELIDSAEYNDSAHKLPLILGKNILGKPVVADLAKMPHLLVAGTTGSGKSVAVNAMIFSLLYKYTPESCRLVMIDPKMLELYMYEGIPHLLSPVVTDPRKAVAALKWVVTEMESRYRAMSILGVRNIGNYNAIIEGAIRAAQPIEKQLQVGFDRATGRPIFETIRIKQEMLPYIVVIVDEIADLMLVAGKEIEIYIQRLAQMARAAGIHLIMATQRPSVDVITGVIKANLPTRISFQVTSKIDSRTILGEQGAEQLLGKGDMLYMSAGGRLERVHGPFVSDKDVELVTAFWKKFGPASYIELTTCDGEDVIKNGGTDAEIDSDDGKDDSVYCNAVEIVLKDRRPTTSYLQRCLKIGYNRAASLIERMEREGIVGAPNHVGKREILIKDKGE